MPTPTETASSTPAPTATLPHTPTPFPTNTATPLPERFIFGYSAGGRELVAQRVGAGGQMVVLVGGIHAGAENNTITLVEELVAHFQTHPADVLPGVTLLFVPAFNPDGAALGRVNAGRYNGNGVDLNRNWGCNWQPTAQFKEWEVSPGSEPFSEPETRALAAFILDARPAAVVFYHAAANGVFAGSCNQASVSQPLAAVLGEATGYPDDQPFIDYAISGEAANWIDSTGIPAVVVELASDRATEFERNLRGVMALQCWLVGEQAAALLPNCAVSQQ